jgi:hypothetical protein
LSLTASLAASSSTCVPMMLDSVNVKLLPNELSTCVCAAKCITVSMRSLRSTYETRSADVMLPCRRARERGREVTRARRWAG